MAGNHGDEYEGQIALTRFIRALDPGAVQGRIIVLPAANLPAAEAGTRTSPLDGGNLNRAFPGDPEGGPTAAIAHYIDSVLFPTLRCAARLPCGRRLAATTCRSPRPGSRATPISTAGRWPRSRRSRRRSPRSGPRPPTRGFRRPPRSRARSWRSAASSAAAATSRSTASRLIEAGLRRLLAHLGSWTLPADAPPPPATRFVEVRDRSYYVYAPERGVFEPLVRLGDQVEAGQPAARVHFVENPARDPVLCHFRRSGLVVCRRALGRCEPGDCLFHLATDMPAPA